MRGQVLERLLEIGGVGGGAGQDGVLIDDGQVENVVNTIASGGC